ncbi:MAG TPA: hypothetical protein VGK33_16525, partial [Chloroflexota bacterium]
VDSSDLQSETGQVTFEATSLSLIPLLVHGWTLGQIAQRRGLARTLRELAILQATDLVRLRPAGEHTKSKVEVEVEQPPSAPAQPPSVPARIPAREPLPVQRAVSPVAPSAAQHRRRYWQMSAAPQSTVEDESPQVGSEPAPRPAHPEPAMVETVARTVPARPIPPPQPSPALPPTPATHATPASQPAPASQPTLVSVPPPAASPRRRGWRQAVVRLFISETPD